MENTAIRPVVDEVTSWPVDEQLDVILRLLYRMEYRLNPLPNTPAPTDLAEARYHLYNLSSTVKGQQTS